MNSTQKKKFDTHNTTPACYGITQQRKFLTSQIHTLFPSFIQLSQNYNYPIEAATICHVAYVSSFNPNPICHTMAQNELSYLIDSLINQWI